ncbi:MAG: hypothetical protein ACUVXI_04200 [bacterium]
MPKDKIGRVVLEMSLKPFRKMGEENIQRVCREVLRQWYPILKLARECSILLWVADGSEILTWKGDLGEEIEWGRYIGFCNAGFGAYIQEERRLERAAKPYADNPPKITYGDLRTIIWSFKAIASEEFGLKLTVGETFDPGPEFAHSNFKYRDHREIIGGGPNSKIGPSFSMICAWSRLKGDSAKYAGYPNGIPDGTSFGEFLGRQSRSFMSAMGFDYIWLSNGFGFSHFAWSCLGENFDGERFGLANYEEIAERTISFWRDFKGECPDFSIEVRGSNFAMGMDLASDLVPYLEIYRGGYLRNPPPNSPWGPLNSDFGLEMVGYMSRIALLPGETFPFRYYPNDPWFWQNPWWDLYDREPFDIYCPMSVGRINDEGEVENPQVIEFLTIDTERGELDERCPLEVIPHIRRAIEDYPDEPGLLTWLYPFEEYHRIAKEHPERIDLVFFGDWFVRGAVNNGLPLNTVISTGDFSKALKANPDALGETILFTPTTILEGTYEEDLIEHVQGGGRAIFYGPLDFAPESLRDLLNIRVGAGLSGDFSLRVMTAKDEFVAWPGRKILKHDPLVSGGPISEVLKDESDRFTEVCAVVRQNGEERIYALTRRLPSWHRGMVGWVRGGNPFSTERNPQSELRLPNQYPEGFLDPTILARYLLSRFGYSFLQRRNDPQTRPIMTFVSRLRNGFVFTGYKPDTTAVWRVGFPQGAPLLVGKEAEVEGGFATYFLDRSFHEECRAFVRQESAGVISCAEKPPFPTGKERTIQISGLADADLTIYPPLDRMDEVVIEKDGGRINVKDQIWNKQIHLRGVTGVLSITW